MRLLPKDNENDGGRAMLRSKQRKKKREKTREREMEKERKNLILHQ